MQMFRRRRVMERISEVIDKFRQKGALSPDKAMTPEELGFPPEFKQAKKKRLGQAGVFIEVNGKYYLSEERLKEVKEKFSQRRRQW